MFFFFFTPTRIECFLYLCCTLNGSIQDFCTKKEKNYILGNMYSWKYMRQRGLPVTDATVITSISTSLQKH